jgi:acetylornithine deacetylase/succinyl-diaminopimelate desuccinylase-like protein
LHASNINLLAKGNVYLRRLKNFSAMNNTLQYIEQNKDRFINELLDLLRIPSVSADSRYKGDVRRMAEALKDRMLDAGVDIVEIAETAGHPIVYAEKMIDESLPTVLVYGHYDVQPADPLELWTSPPFEPVIRKTELHPDGAIYARGACDDKGQMYMHVKAFETLMQTGGVPCNIKFLIEGEEEVGSDHLEEYIREHREELACDMVLISDTEMYAKDVPTLTVGLRGLSYLEVEVTGPNRDLHSGLYGGAVANPINVLCDMISSLHDENRHITIPGFYDRVQTLSDEERALLASAPFSEAEYCRALDIEATMGEQGYSTIERTAIRPTLDVNGIWGGYTGEGAKTVIASKAFAKISMRLVPDQHPDEITEMFARHFRSIAPKGVKVEVRPHHGGEPVVTPVDSAEYAAASAAMEQTFGKKPIPYRGGGSIPIVALFGRELGVNTILMGFGLDSDAIHSPNENYGIWNYFKGIETIAQFYKHYAAARSAAN